MVFDTSVLVEWVRGSAAARELKLRVEKGAVTPHTTDINLFELSYLVCRKEGWDRAARVVENLRRSGYLSVHHAQEFLSEAAQLKCKHAISVVDSFSIGAGEALSLPVLFANREGEIDTALKKGPFKTELRFLSEFERGYEPAPQR
jgi:predicted nucleic acid-binding protein